MSLTTTKSYCNCKLKLLSKKTNLCIWIFTLSASSDILFVLFLQHFLRGHQDFAIEKCIIAGMAGNEEVSHIHMAHNIGSFPSRKINGRKSCCRTSYNQ